MSSTFAPSVSKILLTLAFCSAKPIWIPRNPKLIFQISQKLRRGLWCRRHRRRHWILGQVEVDGCIGKLGLHSRHLAGRMRIACPPPGASAMCNCVADVTVRRVIVTGRGLSNQFAPGPSA